MDRKGFPESYDVGAILRFLSAIKAGRGTASRRRVYSHLIYDVMPGEYHLVDRPDILIFEGINVLQVARTARGRQDRSLRLRLLRFLDLYRRRRGPRSTTGMSTAS